MKSDITKKISEFFFKIKRRTLFGINNFNLNSKSNFKKFVLSHWTWPKKVFLSILLILIIIACLLYTPWAYDYSSYEYYGGQYHFVFDSTTPNIKTKVHFLDAFFMSTSAFTNTGLSVIDIGSKYSLFGQIIIWVAVQLGGFGFISIFYLIGKFTSKVIRTKVFTSSMLHIERGGSKISDSSRMIVRLFFLILIIQFIFAFAISGILYTTEFKEQVIPPSSHGGISTLLPYDHLSKNFPTYQNYGLSFWNALFLSSSSINNAGLDLFGVSSLSIFRNDFGILIQSFVLILFIIGGIGFPVIYDISKRFEWFWKNKIHNLLFKKYSKVIYNEPKPKFSSFSRTCIMMFLVVSLVSIGLSYITEYFTSNASNSSILHYGNNNNEFGINIALNKNWAIFFNTMSTRSAGFSTVNMSNFSESTRWIFIILMYIGTSPSSTGGGIRTTTLYVAFKSILYWFRGIETPLIQKRAIPKKTVLNSFIVIIFAFVLIMVLAIVLFLIDSIQANSIAPIVATEWTFIDFLFECSSAFGTTGLSTGLTMSDEFEWWSYIFLIVLMFIGQMGITSFLATFSKRIPNRIYFKAIEQDIRIG
ncbi:MAG: potassium transporter TrkG [Malacoplasma sp.]